MYSCVYGDEEDHSLIYVAYNMHWETHSFALPKINGMWKVDMSSNVSGAVIEDNNRSVCVEPRSVAILTGTYEIPAKKEKSKTDLQITRRYLIQVIMTKRQIYYLQYLKE